MCLMYVGGYWESKNVFEGRLDPSLKAQSFLHPHHAITPLEIWFMKMLVLNPQPIKSSKNLNIGVCVLDQTPE